MAAYGGLAGIGTALGLIIGGALTQWWSWRIGFFINVPVGLIGILAAPRFLDETEPHAGHLDAAAAITSTVGVSALVFGIAHSATAGWTDPIKLQGVSGDRPLTAGLAVPMLIFGIGQGLGLSTLTTAGMAGVENRDASLAGGLVNVSHHLGGAVGLGILTTLFVAAGGHETGRALLSSRVSASLTGAAVLLALALVVTVVSQLATRRSRSLTTADATALAVREREHVVA